MQEIVTEAKAEFVRAKDRIAKALATTPDDRINWSPSPTSRTPVQQVAHATMGISGIQGMLMGKPWPFSGVDEMDRSLRVAEKEYTTRDHVNSFLESTSAEYLAWLDTLTPEQVASTVDFGFGQFPMASAMTFAADHLRGHAAQIDYTQTIYGDHDWHM
jgi:hypothetical protein